MNRVVWCKQALKLEVAGQAAGARSYKLNRFFAKVVESCV